MPGRCRDRGVTSWHRREDLCPQCQKDASQETRRRRRERGEERCQAGGEGSGSCRLRGPPTLSMRCSASADRPARGMTATSPPSNITPMRSLISSNSSSSEEINTTRCRSPLLLAQRAEDEPGGAQISPVVGVTGGSLGIDGQLRARRSFDVAAGEHADGCVVDGLLDLELGDQAPRLLVHRSPVEPNPLENSLRPIDLRATLSVTPNPPRPGQAVVVDQPIPRRVAAATPRLVSSIPPRRTRPEVTGPLSGDDFTQFLLASPVDAGDPEYLAANTSSERSCSAGAPRLPRVETLRRESKTLPPVRPETPLLPCCSERQRGTSALCDRSSTSAEIPRSSE